MSVFAPEEKESMESGWEKKGFKESIEKSVVSRWNSGFDTFPDPVQCPVKTCKNPLIVEVKNKTLRIYCKNCGFERIIKKHQTKPPVKVVLFDSK